MNILAMAVFTVTSVTLFKGFRSIPDQACLLYVTAGRGCYLLLMTCANLVSLLPAQAATARQIGARLTLDAGRLHSARLLGTIVVSLP